MPSTGDASPLAWSGVDRTTLERLLRAGSTPREIAAAYGRSASLVRLAARRWGLDARALRATSTGLAVTHPEIADQFVCVVDGAPSSYGPADLLSGSGARCRWRCQSCGHEWVASVVNRTRRRSGCPSCARARGRALARSRRAKTPFLSELDPGLAEEFVCNRSRPDRDARSTPGGSHDRILWQCSRGHSWETSARQRVRYSTHCPVCQAGLRVSRLEFRVAAVIEAATGLTVIVDALLPSSSGPAERLDLLVDHLGLFIDLDPSRWHASTGARERDARKVVRLRERPYIRLRPNGLGRLDLPADLDRHQALVRLDDETDVVAWAAAAIGVILGRWPSLPSSLPTGTALEAALARADQEWRALGVGRRGRSLQSVHPAVAEEFVCVVGQPALTAADIPPAGDDRVLWECSRCAGRWEARVANRTRLGTGCPPCAYQRGSARAARPRAGASFADSHPELVHCFISNETSPGRTLDQVKPSSTDRCTWVCPHCGSPWTSTPQALHRNPARGCRGCSYARGVAQRRARERGGGDLRR